MTPHVIALALDLARMPALARASAAPAIPPDVIELMRIAAGSPTACREASAASGRSQQVVVEAAKFYLQQLLFRPDADCYRILGICPGTPRATTRHHMRLLLQWVHPDRNCGLDAVYAERVLKAWREVSADQETSASVQARVGKSETGRPAASSFRQPWIPFQAKGRRAIFRRPWWAGRAWTFAAGATIVFVALFSAFYYLASNQTAAMIPLP